MQKSIFSLKLLTFLVFSTLGLLSSVQASVDQYEGRYIGTVYISYSGLISQPETSAGAVIADIDASGDITLGSGDTGTVNSGGAISWDQPNAFYASVGQITDGTLRANGTNTDSPGLTISYRIEAAILGGSGPELSLSPTSRDHGSDAVSQDSLEVASSVDWTASKFVSWITLVTASGTGDSILTYSLSENTSALPRSGTITVTAGGLNKNFTIIQAGKTQWFSGASDIGEGWLYYDWFKGFKPGPSNWIFHGRHGWLFTLGQDSAGFFLWDVALGRWMFSNETVYPWMYAYGPNEGWLFFFEGGRPGTRYFKRGDTSVVVSEEQLRVD